MTNILNAASKVGFLLLLLLQVVACQNTENKPAAPAAGTWITVENNGAMTLLGKPVANLEAMQAALLDTLSKMPKLPDSIPVHFGSEILMGMRGEVRSSITEARAGAECMSVVRGFYTWYDTFSSQEANQMDFINDQGEHYQLDLPKMDAYFKKFAASGFVGTAFMEDRTAFYKKCEQLWQKEQVGDVPSGVDADPYFCAQDWDIAFFTKSPLTVKFQSDDKALATISGQSYGQTLSREIELVKENGKWLVARVVCDLL